MERKKERIHRQLKLERKKKTYSKISKEINSELIK